MARIEPVFGGISSEIENPYQLGDAQLIDDEVVTFSKPRILDFSGRISLARFWLIRVPLVLILPCVLLAFFMVGLRHQLGVLLIVAVTVVVPAILLDVSLLVRRARDLSWSPMIWGILYVFPVIGFVATLPLVMLPGRKAINKYGPPNPPLSTLVKLLTALLVVLTLVTTTVLIAYFPQYNPQAIYEWFANALVQAYR
ncbi:DUF805 domain-containing protein [Pseudomonas mediterranea]|uniref:DUF805 domain-containing protein n=1 Tax=Pseudomonas mediterranea TaxID=183795 RepID=UPI0006D8A133|nr:DUF805 domain-containing protein [Pseudomonas mediterranea]MBL0842875.1 DUF805 domain-containing protein [Pseudomonas mediterranea]MDU9028536.1 DUF805 domain-containing protein [Pseudomonas mediterranea]QHA83287.1 DUF805 domain-containing protein [Pseudomonas mediterranea]UZD99112.1 DUF805 domain-containing protein [Pseudomonas mediterranea]CAH0297550.1 hypothetical protein SRABI112_04400 [Pseudomonas mediterranea]